MAASLLQPRGLGAWPLAGLQPYAAVRLRRLLSSANRPAHHAEPSRWERWTPAPAAGVRQPATDARAVDQRELNRQLMEARNTEEVLALCGERAPELNGINLSTALSRLARAPVSTPTSGGSARDRSDLGADPRLGALLGALRARLRAGAAARATEPIDPRSLAGCAHALAVLRTRAPVAAADAGLMGALAAECAARAGEFDGRALTSVCWAFARGAAGQSRARTLDRPLPVRAPAAPGAGGAAATAADAAAAAAADPIATTVLRALRPHVDGRAAEMSAQGLAMTAWAYATAGGGRAAADGAPWRGLATALAAAARRTGGAAAADAAAESGEAAAGGALGAHDVSTGAWALARAQGGGPAVGDALRALAAAACGASPSACACARDAEGGGGGAQCMLARAEPRHIVALAEAYSRVVRAVAKPADRAAAADGNGNAAVAAAAAVDAAAEGARRAELHADAHAFLARLAPHAVRALPALSSSESCALLRSYALARRAACQDWAADHAAWTATPAADATSAAVAADGGGARPPPPPPPPLPPRLVEALAAKARSESASLPPHLLVSLLSLLGGRARDDAAAAVPHDGGAPHGGRGRGADASTDAVVRGALDALRAATVACAPALAQLEPATLAAAVGSSELPHASQVRVALAAGLCTAARELSAVELAIAASGLIARRRAATAEAADAGGADAAATAAATTAAAAADDAELFALAEIARAASRLGSRAFAPAPAAELAIAFARARCVSRKLFAEVLAPAAAAGVVGPSHSRASADGGGRALSAREQEQLAFAFATTGVRAPALFDALAAAALGRLHAGGEVSRPRLARFLFNLGVHGSQRPGGGAARSLARAAWPLLCSSPFESVHERTRAALAGALLAADGTLAADAPSRLARAGERRAPAADAPAAAEAARAVPSETAELELSRLLARHGWAHGREVGALGGLLAIDLACADRLVGVELDGPTHFVCDLALVRQGMAAAQLRAGAARLDGPSRARSRLLANRGWALVRLPWWRLHEARAAGPAAFDAFGAALARRLLDEDAGARARPGGTPGAG